MIFVFTIGSLYWSSQSQPPINRETGYSNVLIQDWPISWRNANIDRLLLYYTITIDYYYGDRPPPIIFPAKSSAENAEPKVCTVFGDSAANFLNLNTHTNILFFKQITKPSHFHKTMRHIIDLQAAPTFSSLICYDILEFLRYIGITWDNLKSIFMPK